MGDGLIWEVAAFFGHALSSLGLLSAVDCRAILPERFVDSRVRVTKAGCACAFPVRGSRACEIESSCVFPDV